MCISELNKIRAKTRSNTVSDLIKIKSNRIESNRIESNRIESNQFISPKYIYNGWGSQIAVTATTAQKYKHTIGKNILNEK